MRSVSIRTFILHDYLEKNNNQYDGNKVENNIKPTHLPFDDLSKII